MKGTKGAVPRAEAPSSQHRGWSVTGCAARVRRRLARDRDELPGVRAVGQGQLEDAVHAADARLAVRDDQRVDGVEPFAARPHDDLADPVHGVGDTGGRLRGEALVVAHMPVDDQLGMGGVQVVPERLYRRAYARL